MDVAVHISVGKTVAVLAGCGVWVGGNVVAVGGSVGVFVGTGVSVGIAVGGGVAMAGGAQICSKGTTGGGSPRPHIQPSTSPEWRRRPFAPIEAYDHSPLTRCQ